MLSKKQDFKIVPIFNQNHDVWVDFMKIEKMCDKSLGYNYTNYDEWRVLRGHEQDWKNKEYNFAFAAYNKTQMIGFAKGYSYTDIPGWTYLDALYVLPKYHKMGIGRQLLNMVEKTSSMVAERIQLIPLSGSVNFYQSNGYGWGADEGVLGKYLPDVYDDIVPVFQWKKKSFCVKFNVKVDSKLLKQNKYQPVFVHVNDGLKIDAVALRAEDGEDKFWFKPGQEFLQHELSYELNKFR